MRVVSSTVSLSLLALISGVGAQDYGAPGGWYGGGYHSSTAEEGVARGMADLTRSAGAANLMNSEAAGKYEDARRKYMENRVYGTDAYFDMRRINREAREAESGPRPTRDDLVRYSRARTPSRLSVSELDPLTGQISWPAVLMDNQYAKAREAVEELAQLRAKAGYLDSSQRVQLKRVSDYLLAQLRGQISVYPPQEYVQAKQFIESLSYELYAQAAG